MLSREPEDQCSRTQDAWVVRNMLLQLCWTERPVPCVARCMPDLGLGTRSALSQNVCPTCGSCLLALSTALGSRLPLFLANRQSACCSIELDTPQWFKVCRSESWQGADWRAAPPSALGSQHPHWATDTHLSTSALGRSQVPDLQGHLHPHTHN